MKSADSNPKTQKMNILSKATIVLGLLAWPIVGWSAETMNVQVNGMVCDFCAQGIEKKLKSDPSVEKVHVSLGEKKVQVVSKEGSSLSEERIRESLKKAGYAVISVSKE
jgi:copper chaperone CopZ